MSFLPFARVTALAVALGVGVAALAPSGAEAQQTQIKASPKGTIGLGVIGAEIGFAVPALAGAKDWYWYVIGGSIGAAGGAVGGWFAFDKPGREKWSVAMLVTGMALVVPTMVLSLSMTAYNPEDEPSVIPAEEAGGATQAQADRRRLAEHLVRAGPGLVRRSEDGWLLTLPAVAVVSRTTPKEQLLLGVADAPELQVPLLTGVF